MSLVAAYASDSDDERDVGSSASRMGLPPPRASAPRRARVIHVDTSVPDADADAAAADAPKPAPKPAAKSDGAPHSLLSMLPAPSAAARPAPPAPAPEDDDDDDSRAPAHDTPARDNEGFRAMLGLAPRERAAPKAEAAVPTKAERLAAAEEAAAAAAAAPLAQPQARAPTSSAATLSAAPDVSDREPTPPPPPPPEAYRGWHQDPDGTWVPVTPEAHAVYAQWLAENAEPPPLEEQDIGTQRQFARHDVVAALDADAEMHAHWDARPSARASGPAPGATKPDMTAQLSERLQSDRLTNVRARTRGQLTSLIVQAQEKRQVLEERWAHGRHKMRENKKRYGF